MKRLNKKLDLRVQTFEKKLVIQQVKEQKLTNMIEATNEELEKTKLERDTYAALVCIKLILIHSFPLFTIIIYLRRQLRKKKQID